MVFGLEMFSHKRDDDLLEGEFENGGNELVFCFFPEQERIGRGV